MAALYNELEPYAAQWLRNLIQAGHIADGEVLEQDIRTVEPRDLEGFTQVHLFAGIGVWSYALRLAGWPDDRPVWTASCPCQPFSDAGQKKGFDDDRHLWPWAFRLAQELRPTVLFGEQVASQDGLEWLSVVQADLETEGYAFGAVDLCAASVGAPHRRQRLWFVAESNGSRSRRHELLGNTSGHGTGEHPGKLHGHEGQCQERATDRADPSRHAGPSLAWSDPDWALCHDPGGSRWRPIEPGTLPLVDGFATRVGRCRAYGNAIVPQVAEQVIRAYLETV